MIDLERWRENPPTLCLLLTRRCNFRCDHCMYDCGKNFRGYMKNSTLRLVKSQVDRLIELEIYPGVNLVGGEPTLNLMRFGQILSEVMTWDVQVEMTTNGWWLHSTPKNTRGFFDAVRRHVSSDGEGVSGGFSVRISNDSHHDSFRPDWITRTKKSLQHTLSGLWEYDGDGIFWKSTPTCDTCWSEFRQVPDDEMCKCGGEVHYEEEEICQRPPAPCDGDPWIHVEPHGGHERVLPQGRGEMWGETGPGTPKCHYAGDALTYLPNGKLMDICCRGSWCEFGDVGDDPLLLLELSTLFARDATKRCMGCRENAADWGRKSLRKSRALISAEIAVLDASL